MPSEPPIQLPFEDSRRLTGSNLHFAGPGATLEAVVPLDEAALAAWRSRIAAGRAALGWPADGAVAVRRHARGVTLAFAAPLDQLYTATELGEWALCATYAGREPQRWQAMLAAQRTLPAEVAEAAAGEPSIVDLYLERPGLDDVGALEQLARRARAEARPVLRALAAEAARRGLPLTIDDELLTLGAGATSHSWRMAELPTLATVPWDQLGAVPIVLVTGSNGKTTTVRAIAAMLRARGLVTGVSSTDGVVVDAAVQASGDYSGPAGARTVLRHPEVEAAVLETARGGILRRGLAVELADVAVITNVSADHFGEYGIDDVAGLAAVKLAVSRALSGGTLVLNADDALLVALAPAALTAGAATPAWFALDADAAPLAAARERGEATCGLRHGHLMLEHGDARHDLGAVTTMPIAFGGRAAHNVANLAASALAAAALGVPATEIARCCGSFGADPADNLGRLMRFERAGAQVLVDYAHNVDGLARLAPVVDALRHRRAGARGGLVLLLGHAGNRMDEDIRGVVDAALALEPDLVVVKEISGMARGRELGAVAALVERALLERGLGADRVVVEHDEFAAAQRALAWCGAGDVALLLIHGREARERLLDELQR